MSLTNEEQECVDQFRKYLRIPTVHPNPDYAPAVAFLHQLCSEIRGVECQTIELVPKNPFLIATFVGKYPKKKSLMLSSHMDVVPVNRASWSVDPFEADVIDGEIYARGCQDMKCVTIQQIIALKRLIKGGFVPNRTVHLVFTPDEEVGSARGVELFAKSVFFKNLNVGFVMDEGIASPTETMPLFYAERATYSVIITCCGNAGHGSQFIHNTAAEKFLRIFTEIQNYRKQQEILLNEHQNLKPGDVNTVNINMIRGGTQINVVPSSLQMFVDFRINPTMSIPEFIELVNEWVALGGEGCTWERFNKNGPNEHYISKNDGDWWHALNRGCKNAKIQTELAIFPAGTDAKFIRKEGYQCFGFSPLYNTKILLHDDDERLSIDVFLRGIEIYADIIKELLSIE